MIIPTQEIITFWFGNQEDALAVAHEKNALWWEKNPALDQEVKNRFESLLAPEMTGTFDQHNTPYDLLARIILCDQFPRNMFRGSPQAFAYDDHARELAQQLIKQGSDQTLRHIERAFAYLPFEHAENMEDQHLSVSLFTALLMDAPASYKPMFTEQLQYAMRHRDIIYDFGRFPHRNIVLGRVSTVKEIEFLKQPHSSF